MTHGWTLDGFLWPFVSRLSTDVSLIIFYYFLQISLLCLDYSPDLSFGMIFSASFPSSILFILFPFSTVLFPPPHPTTVIIVANNNSELLCWNYENYEIRVDEWENTLCLDFSEIDRYQSRGKKRVEQKGC